VPEDCRLVDEQLKNGVASEIESNLVLEAKNCDVGSFRRKYFV
jgi:hypothetical protein